MQPYQAAALSLLEITKMEELSKSNIYSLPNEILSKIVHFAASKLDEDTWEYRIDHEFLVFVISKVSTRFQNIASNP